MTATADPSSDVDEPGSKSAGMIGAALVLGALVLLGWFNTTMVAVVLVIAFVVFMHELGHFLTARWTGMKATEFFLGFGPRIFSFRRGETDFGLKPVLLGAYVKIIGMHNLDEVDPADEQRTYRQQSYPKRVLVASAGSLMHFGMAFVGLIMLFSVFGEPTWVVREAPSTFLDGAAAPAGEAGVLPGDRVLTVDGRSAEDWGDFVDIVKGSGGETVSLLVERDGAERTIDVLVATDPETGSGRIGIAADEDYRTTSLPSAVGSAFTSFFELIGQTLAAMWQIFSNIGELVDRVFSPPNDPSANANLETRPVSIVGAVQLGANDGFSPAMRMILFIQFNMFIGVFNLLPLLPLDGGHIVVATYERLREGRSGRRYMIDITRLMPITYAVVAFLVFFGLGTVYLDIANPVRF